MRVGVFTSDWNNGHIAKDGAVLGFEDLARAVEQWAGSARDVDIIPLTFEMFLDRSAIRRALTEAELIYANCGPLAALLLSERQQIGVNTPIIREVRTLAWVGYAFQEFVARDLALPNDLCVHPSEFAQSLWQAIREDSGDRSFYPMLTEPRTPPRTPPREGLHCGFFSRISADKGATYLAPILDRLKSAGWPVASLSLCGDVADQSVVEDLGLAMARRGIAFECHGELPYSKSMRVMANTDAVLFPSVSSYETLGRVVPEAYNNGRRVIASDFAAAHDLMDPAFRIPLVDVDSAGSTDNPFSIGRLDVDAWQPPDPDTPCFRETACEAYRAHNDSIPSLIDSLPTASVATSPIRFAIEWDGFETTDAVEWCRRVQQRLQIEYRSSPDLIDLGGAIKRTIMHCGFCPRARFFTAPECRSAGDGDPARVSSAVAAGLT